MLCLDEQYEVEHLFKPAFKHLSTLCPSALSGLAFSRIYESIENFNGLPLAAYQLAKGTQYLSFLPASMYTSYVFAISNHAPSHTVRVRRAHRLPPQAGTDSHQIILILSRLNLSHALVSGD